MTNQYIILNGDVLVNGGTPSVVVTGTPSVGQVIEATSASTASWQTISTGTVTLAGDVTGPSNANTAININGTSVPATPSANQVLVATGGTASTWQQIANAQVSNTAAIAGTKVSPAFGSQNISTSGTLNVGGATVTSLQDTAFSSNGVVHNDSSGNFTSSQVVNADVSATAAIVVTKLAAGTSAQILQNNGTPTPTWTTISGDVSITNTGATSVVAIQANPVQSGVLGSTQDGYVLTWTNSANQWQPRAPSTLIADGIDYHFCNSASSISTYNQLEENATATQATGTASTSSSSKVLIQAFATDAGTPNVELIPAGDWEFNFWAYASLTGAFTSQIIFDVYTRTAGGTETLLFTVNSANIQVTSAAYNTVIYSYPNDTVIANTTRIVIKVSGQSSNALATTISFVYDGTTMASLVRTPLSGAALQLGGDVTGPTNSNTVVNIHGASVPAAGSLTTGNVLQVSGSSALTYAALNLAGGAGFVTGSLPTANQVAQSMGGDVAGTTADSTVTLAGDVTGRAGTTSVVKIQGTSVASPLGTGNVLTYNGTSLIWSTGVAPTIVTKTSGPYQVAGTNYLVLCNHSSALTIQCPTAVATAGTYFTVKDISGAAETNNISLTQTASEKIENVAATRLLTANFGSWTFVSDGVNWWEVY